MRFVGTASSGRTLQAGEAGDMESEWATFKAFTAQTAVRTCGQMVVGACPGSNPKTCWWTQVMRKAIKLKKEAFRA